MGNLQKWGAHRGDKPITQIGIHNTEGEEYEITTGMTLSTIGKNIALMFGREDRGTHLVIELDHVYQVGDLATRAGKHLHHTWSNWRSIGIEVVARKVNGKLFIDRRTLDTLIVVLRRLCISFWIQMFLAVDSTPYKARTRLRNEDHEFPFGGIAPHWLYTDQRSKWDIGPPALAYLIAHGPFNPVNVGERQDVKAIQRMQAQLGITVDGIARAQVRNALLRQGYHHGMYALGVPDLEPEEDLPAEMTDRMALMEIREILRKRGI